MLIDEVEITLKAGDGGVGRVSFGTRERGPDGGNGGDGGDVYVEVLSNLDLLSLFQSRDLIEAEKGVDGGKKKMAGRRGEDITVKLPVGTRVVDIDTGESWDFDTLGEKRIFLRGGRGGIGNFDLRSSRNTTPMSATPPEKGEIRNLKLILRFIADYGLVGLPSSGKSSLLNELTNAEVKTASYHFTTLSPNLGVLPSRKVIADIPGLIEGAHEGRGLGIKFLKHIEKVQMLLHCIAADSATPLKDYEVIRGELGSYDKELLEKDELIILTKTDLIDESELKEKLKILKKLKRKIISTSIHDLESIENLQKML